MSLEGLREFNHGFGFAFHKEIRFCGSKRDDTAIKILFAIPFFGYITDGKPDLKLYPAASCRAILASTIVGLPIVFLLDIIATLFTQPIGRALEKRRAQQLQ
jgi:hypothetical protein